MRVTAAVDRLRREGVDVIDFGTGEPDFGTPAPIGQAGHAAIDANFTKYTPVGGIWELKRAICDRYKADYGVTYTESEVITSAGGKQALFNTAMALFGPDDEVLVHVPGWPSLTEQVKIADALPILVGTSAHDGFAIRAQPFIDAITPKTRGVIINSPCNPTGALMSEGELATLAAETSRRGIWIVLDLCYEKLIYDSTPHNLPAVLDRHCRDLAVICGSASKAYAMTGWRCGWTLAPAAVVSAESAVQSHATSNVSSITQKAVVAALTGSQEPVGRMLDEYRRRRDALYGWLAASPYLACRKPDGAFYMFVNVHALLSGQANGGFASSAEVAEALLEEARVAVTPGEAFDAPGFVRISFATSMELLEEGSRRLVAFAAKHAPAAARHHA